MSFDQNHLMVAFQGQVRIVARVLELSGSTVRLCEHGRDAFREVSWQGAEMILHDRATGESRRFRKLIDTVPELILAPFPMPDPRPISDERVQEIQGEIWRRVERDQEIIRFVPGGSFPKDQPWLRPPYDPKTSWGELGQIERVHVIGDNTRYLKKIVSEVGWIDVDRFGYATSGAAFLIVQHSDDLPLMLAALPRIKADVDAGKIDGGPYALLYDRLHLYLGGKQLYGSQVFTDETGQPSLLPVEEPDRLDELRASVGLNSIAEYLRAFGGKEVRISSACATPEILKARET